MTRLASVGLLIAALLAVGAGTSACSPAELGVQEQLAAVAEELQVTEVDAVTMTLTNGKSLVTAYVSSADGRRSASWDGENVQQYQSPADNPSMPVAGPPMPINSIDLAGLLAMVDSSDNGGCITREALVMPAQTGVQTSWWECQDDTTRIPGTYLIDGHPASDSHTIMDPAGVEALDVTLRELFTDGTLTELTQSVATGYISATGAPSAVAGGYCTPVWFTDVPDAPVLRSPVAPLCASIEDAEPAAKPSFRLSDYRSTDIAAVWQLIDESGMGLENVIWVQFTANADGTLAYDISSSDPYDFPSIKGTINPR